MWFFTGKGDEGKTDLFDGSRVKKNDPRLELIGSIDELNAFTGLIINRSEEIQIIEDMKSLQDLLSKTMGLIAGAKDNALFDFNLFKARTWLEDRISFYGKELDNPKSFTFAGDSEVGVYCDICRTISRRVERFFTGIDHANLTNAQEIAIFLNRLSSFFYILRQYEEQK